MISAPVGLSEEKRNLHGSYGVWWAENAAEDPETSFLIDPDEQGSLLERIWARNEELVGIVHSHPRSGPEPSERDRAVAESQPPGLTWVIVGLEPAVDYWFGELP